MPDPKPLASLSSGLLARKGGARPAMRRQNIISPASGDHPSHEDLGWNDMGYDVDPPQNPIPTVASVNDSDVDNRKSGILSAAIPEVVKQQDELNRTYADDDADVQHSDAKPATEKTVEQPEKARAEAQDILSKKPVQAAVNTAQFSAAAQPKKQFSAKLQNASGKRAAFTLRLERERHLRLRLACAIRNQSAQNMVTEALDAFLATIPELDEVANKLPKTAQY